MFSEVAPLSPRYVLEHIKHLPDTSHFAAEVRGGKHFRGWDESRYLQAATVNAIRTLQYILVAVNSDPKGPKPKPVTPYPLPDDLYKKKTDKPGSFGFIARRHLAAQKQAAITN